MRTSLPIDTLLPEIVSSLARNQFLVVEAPPGAGKTTRLPRALFLAEPNAASQIIVTEPRRLAARLAARYVAAEFGEEVGGVVGYSVRFEERCSKKTRIRYVTEGLLLRQLLSSPELPGVRVVVLDEFHERHLAGDQLLVLLKRLALKRKDLRLVVMSATLDAEPIARFLGNCPRLRSEGRAYPLTIAHENDPDDRPLEKRAASAVKQLLNGEHGEGSGHVLVFLPGQRDIQRVTEQLGRSPALCGVDVLPLHGSMPIQAQAKAVAPSERRKVVLATNVAESSITVDGVTAVVDSGLARIAGFSPWTGQATLETAEISRSSAIQRAGRAGRTAAGQVIRLYSEGSFRRRPAQDLPELQRLDLTELVLTLSSLGLSCASELKWLDPPPESALASASQLLTSIGALNEGKLTPTGQRMLTFPLAPRFARLVYEGEQLGIADEACLAAALLSERDVRPQPAFELRDLETGRSDLQERIDRYRDAEYDEFHPRALRAAGLDGSRVAQVRSSYQQLRRLSRDRGETETDPEAVELKLRRALLAAFPDRVARRTATGKARLILVNGSTADLSESSVVRHDSLLVALDVEEQSPAGRKGDGRVRVVSAIEADWLLETFPDEVAASDEHIFNSEKQRVEVLSRLSYGSVTLEESRIAAAPSPETARVLADACKTRLAAIFGKGSKVEGWLNRAGVLQQHLPEAELVAFSQSGLSTLLVRACEHVGSIAELTTFDYITLLESQLTQEQRRLLRIETPEQIQLPSGRRLEVNYEPGKDPWVASRLQDFFGLEAGPRICRGKVPVVLHLLAPNQRAVQVTADLSGFWSRHYTEVRKELRRRYPRHPWPEDGRTAAPPEPRPPRTPQKKRR